MLKRAIETRIDAYLKGKDHKIFFIWGPRRSGKTTILKKLSTLLSVPVFNFDLQSDTEKFIARREVLEGLVKEHKIILIDEVQNYPSATVVLKILHDEFAVKIIATGSSELRQKGSGEFDTLAGRFTDNYCLPLSVREIIENCNVLTYEEEIFTQELSVSLQIFGAYPEVYTRQDLSETERMDLLQNIFDTYVLKDIVKIYDLKNQKLAHDILTKIALQLGSEASLREIAGSLSANVSTVANYIEIFIKNYILIPLPSFKTNKRRAVSKNQKLYFYDPGIRNILVRDFRKLDLRPDKGGLFENFIISEVEKRRKNLGLKQNMYFYREYSGKEVDLVLEDYYKNYYCMEIKTAGKNRIKNVFPLKSKFAVIDSNNYLEKINRTFHK
ncbi:MAG TPA: hypothetical protein DHT43_05790 [Deltaproteobacteria bacterium]|nr:hypothetical protein [Deltaproteobacteria bacterium]